MSPLQKVRIQFQPKLPDILQNIASIAFEPVQSSFNVANEIKDFFPLTHAHEQSLKFSISNKALSHYPKRVGVVLSGGQAPGGHNVIAGLYDALKKLNNQTQLFGFLNGLKGVVDNKYIEITLEKLEAYRNQGGFDLIGSGRTKVETSEQLQKAEATVRGLQLDGLVVIGGDDSNTNAAVLAEYFLAHQCNTAVVGVPKTIDGDLKSEDIEISFGFDTACKTYSEIIGNVARDALSAKKYYYFIKLMGRSASHVTLECALQTHPNMTLIGEEIAANAETLESLVMKIADMICQRSLKGKDYGVILIPEGIIEFIPEFKILLKELNQLLASYPKEILQSTTEGKIHYTVSKLSFQAANCFRILPKSIQEQLLIDRDAHGNVQVSQIETERFFIEMVKNELNNRRKASLLAGDSQGYKGQFSGQPLFCGYEGRSALPSNFDAQYCYALGFVAAILIDNSATGYICSIKNLASNIDEWTFGAHSIVHMIHMEERNGKNVPVIAKALVDLRGKPFTQFRDNRDHWMLEDQYISPGPIQFFGPSALTDSITHTLTLESETGVNNL